MAIEKEMKKKMKLIWSYWLLNKYRKVFKYEIESMNLLLPAFECN